MQPKEIMFGGKRFTFPAILKVSRRVLMKAIIHDSSEYAGKEHSFMFLHLF